MKMVAPELAKHMEIYLEKHMEVDEDCSTYECPTDCVVPLEFGVYYLICIIKEIIIDAFSSF